MEWDWWSRMQGSSAPKRLRQGKWWSHLGEWPQKSARCGGRWSRSFGVLPDVDLDSVHVKSLDEILREKEMKRKKEQGIFSDGVRRIVQENTGSDSRVVQPRNKTPVRRMKICRYNFLKVKETDKMEKEEEKEEVVEGVEEIEEEGEDKKLGEDETGNDAEEHVVQDTDDAETSVDTLLHEELGVAVEKDTFDSTQQKEEKEIVQRFDSYEDDRVHHQMLKKDENDNIVTEDVQTDLQVDTSGEESLHGDADDGMEMYKGEGEGESNVSSRDEIEVNRNEEDKSCYGDAPDDTGTDKEMGDTENGALNTDEPEIEEAEEMESCHGESDDRTESDTSKIYRENKILNTDEQEKDKVNEERSYRDDTDEGMGNEDGTKSYHGDASDEPQMDEEVGDRESAVFNTVEMEIQNVEGENYLNDADKETEIDKDEGDGKSKVCDRKQDENLPSERPKVISPDQSQESEDEEIEFRLPVNCDEENSTALSVVGVRAGAEENASPRAEDEVTIDISRGRREEGELRADPRDLEEAMTDISQEDLNPAAGGGSGCREQLQDATKVKKVKRRRAWRKRRMKSPKVVDEQAKRLRHGEVRGERLMEKRVMSEKVNQQEMSRIARGSERKRAHSSDDIEAPRVEQAETAVTMGTKTRKHFHPHQPKKEEIFLNNGQTATTLTKLSRRGRPSGAKKGEKILFLNPGQTERQRLLRGSKLKDVTSSNRKTRLREKVLVDGTSSGYDQREGQMLIRRGRSRRREETSDLDSGKIQSLVENSSQTDTDGGTLRPSRKCKRRVEKDRAVSADGSPRQSRLRRRNADEGKDRDALRMEKSASGVNSSRGSTTESDSCQRESEPVITRARKRKLLATAPAETPFNSSTEARENSVSSSSLAGPEHNEGQSTPPTKEWEVPKEAVTESSCQESPGVGQDVGTKIESRKRKAGSKIALEYVKRRRRRQGGVEFLQRRRKKPGVSPDKKNQVSQSEIPQPKDDDEALAYDAPTEDTTDEDDATQNSNLEIAPDVGSGEKEGIPPLKKRTQVSQVEIPQPKDSDEALIYDAPTEYSSNEDDATPQSNLGTEPDVRSSEDAEQTPPGNNIPEKIPFSEILANPPQVLLPKLKFTVSISLDRITLKKKRRDCKRRGEARRMTPIARKARKMTRGLKAVEDTWNRLGFQKPSRLLPLSRRALISNPASETASQQEVCHQTTSPGGPLSVGQESRTATFVEDARGRNPLQDDSVADHSECPVVATIVEPPEVAHTVEVVSTDVFPSPATSCTPPEAFDRVAEAVMSILSPREVLPIKRRPSQSESVAYSSESSQQFVIDERALEDELESQVNIINSEYESMVMDSSHEAASSEEYPASDVCFGSPAVKVVVSTLAASACTDSPLVSFASQSATDESYIHNLPPVKIFLGKLSESESTDVALGPCPDQLDGGLLSHDLMGVGVADAIEGSSLDDDVQNSYSRSDEYVENSEDQGDEMNVDATADGEACLQRVISDPEDTDGVSMSRPSHGGESSHQQGHTDDEAAGKDCLGEVYVSPSHKDPSHGGTGAEQVEDEAISPETSPDLRIPCSPCKAPPPPPPLVILTSSTVYGTLLPTSTAPSFCMAASHEDILSPSHSQSVTAASCTCRPEIVSKDCGRNLDTPERQKTLLSQPKAASASNSNSQNKSGPHFGGEVTLPPRGEDFVVPEEDRISLTCDTESFLQDLEDELTEIDRQIGQSERGAKSTRSPAMRRNRSQGTSAADDASRRKKDHFQQDIASASKHEPLRTVDWSAVAQYQPISNSLAGADSSTHDLRGLIRRDEGRDAVFHRPSSPPSAARNWANQRIPKGFCFDFVRNGCCRRRVCHFKHYWPEDSTQAQVNDNRMVVNIQQTEPDIGENSNDGIELDHPDSDGSRSPVFQAALKVQRCTSWKETREAVIELCWRCPDVASCKPVLQVLLRKLLNPDRTTAGEMFCSFVAIFKRHLCENANDPSADGLKRVLSRLGINCATLCYIQRLWNQAHHILACLHANCLPYLPELSRDVLVPHPVFEAFCVSRIADAWVPIVIQVCAEVGEIETAIQVLEATSLPEPVWESRWLESPEGQLYCRNLVELAKLSADKQEFSHCLIFLKRLHGCLPQIKLTQLCNYIMEKALASQDEAYFVVYQEMERDPMVQLDSGNYRALITALWDSGVDFKQCHARQLHQAGLAQGVYPRFRASKTIHEAVLFLDFTSAEVALTMDCFLRHGHTRDIVAGCRQQWASAIRISFAARDKDSLQLLRNTDDLGAVTRHVDSYFVGLVPPIRWIRSTASSASANVSPMKYILDLESLSRWLQQQDG